MGAFLFTLSYGSQKDTFLFGKISAGKVTLAATGVSKYPALFENLSGVIVAGIIAAVFMLVAWKLPSADR